MLIHARSGGTARLLPAIIVAVACVALAALGWLGWHLVERDRDLENQSQPGRFANVTALLAADLERSLGEWEALLATAAQGTVVTLPADTALLVLDSHGVTSRQGMRLPYYPQVSSPPEAPSEGFAAVEIQEIRMGDLAGAADAYRRMAATDTRPVRAAALARLARCLRKAHRFQEAIAVYAELAFLDATPVFGDPAALLAMRERAVLFTTIGNAEASRRETASLTDALWKGQFTIDHATFDSYTRTLPQSPSTDKAYRVAEAVYDLWPRWKQQAEGRAAWSGEGLAVVTVWRQTPAGTVVVVGGVDSLLTATSASDLMRNHVVALAIEESSGRTIWGGLPAGAAGVASSLRETGLPWILRVAFTDSAVRQAMLVQRRNVLLAGLGLAALVIAAGSGFVLRTVNRELKVARLQSDFVAAVSHEFRAPLTAMRHLTEMLEEGGAAASRLPRYYSALGKETRRLQGLVESLLDFGRMEAGRRVYRMEDVDAVELASRVVKEFRERADSPAQRLEIDAAPETIPIRADRDALALALGNLLDNAVKYSPTGSTVRVSVRREGNFAAIAVEDQGTGIANDEQREVFRKFTRGAAARDLNVKGTGIGLTMADSIVKEHGGHMDLDSELGRGSRFTIWLPLVPPS